MGATRLAFASGARGRNARTSAAKGFGIEVIPASGRVRWVRAFAGMTFEVEGKPLQPPYLWLACLAGEHEIGQGPDERVEAVRASGAGHPVAHLVFKFRKGTDMVHKAALIKRCNRLGADAFSARCSHKADGGIRHFLPHDTFNHFAALIGFCDDAVCTVCANAA